MSEIKDRQDAASDIDPIVAALADDTQAAAAVEGLGTAAEAVDTPVKPDVAGAEPPALEAGTPEFSGGADSDAADQIAVADIASGYEIVEPRPAPSDELADTALAADEPALDPDADFGDEVPAEPIASDDIADAIEAALLDEAPEAVAKPLAATAFEHMPAAYADTIVELDVGPGRVDDDAPLLDVDLEDGIASVFAALHAARDSAPVEPLGDLEAADGVTFRLLGELDRLWHRAA
jgi:hypothetical protein